MRKEEDRTAPRQGWSMNLNQMKKFNEEYLGMNNIKRAALNISSKFGLLNSHRTLVLAISEERQVHETILKLVLARVNASTSLLRWAKKEENQVMKDCVCQLYDISLMYASVQREFAEQSNLLGSSLKEILTCEVALDALRKNLKEVREKKERLQKVVTDGNRRKSSIASPAEEICKLQEEEEELQNELDVKVLKAEIFKSTSVKNSLKAVCDAHLKFAEKMSLIFTAAQKVIAEIQDVPDHITSQNRQKEHCVVVKNDVVVELAKSLNIHRPMASNMASPSSIFHIDVGRSNAKINHNNHIKALHKAEIKKTISNPVLLSPPARPVQSISRDPTEENFDTDFVIISNSQPPANAPPPVPGHRTRSQTNNVTGSVYAIGTEAVPRLFSDGTVHDYDEVEIGNFQGDTSFGRLYRSASDSTITSSKTNTEEYGYSEPWENVQDNQDDVVRALNEELNKQTKPHSNSEPCNSNPYQCPFDSHNDKAYQSHRKHKEEGIYSEPTGLVGNDGQSNIQDGVTQEMNQDAVNLFENVQYIDNRLIKETVKSKHDVIENIALTKNLPSPAPKPRPKIDKHFSKKMYSSTKLPSELKNGEPKKIPPKPKPRPSTVIYESPSVSHNLPEYVCPDSLNNSPIRGVGSVRERAAQMSSMIQPASLIPSLTQAKLKESETANYANL